MKPKHLTLLAAVLLATLPGCVSKPRIDSTTTVLRLHNRENLWSAKTAIEGSSYQPGARVGQLWLFGTDYTGNYPYFGIVVAVDDGDAAPGEILGPPWHNSTVDIVTNLPIGDSTGYDSGFIVKVRGEANPWTTIRGFEFSRIGSRRTDGHAFSEKREASLE
jgi:hypothetical protein